VDRVSVKFKTAEGVGPVGERRAADPDCMKRVVSRLSEADIAAVAAWLAVQDPPSDSSPESSNLVRMPLACGSQS